MMLSDPGTQVELPLPATLLDTAWQRSQAYATPRSQWTAFLNQICLDIVLPWLQAEYDFQATSILQAWELVNGTAIQSDRQKIILIPDKSIDTSQLAVPQEWIDLPEWAGDYYLAIQVNPDESCLRIWSYTTHEHLKLRGTHDLVDRTYNLDALSLVSDLAVFGVIQQLAQQLPSREVTQAALTPLAPVAAPQAENLLQRLANPEIDQPRLEIPFATWGSLLTSAPWRDRLTRSRQTGTLAPARLVTQLSQWFQNQGLQNQGLQNQGLQNQGLQNIASSGWQALERLINPAELATRFRQNPAPESQSDAASAATVRQVKSCTFGSQTLLLILAATATADEKFSIRIQLCPEARQDCLPPQLLLALQTTTGETIQSVQTGDRYNSIQLRPFKCRSGTEFKVQIAGQIPETTEINAGETDTGETDTEAADTKAADTKAADTEVTNAQATTDSVTVGGSSIVIEEWFQC